MLAQGVAREGRSEPQSPVLEEGEAFGFGCLQFTLAVNLLIPDEFMRRLMGVA